MANKKPTNAEYRIAVTVLGILIFRTYRGTHVWEDPAYIGAEENGQLVFRRVDYLFSAPGTMKALPREFVFKMETPPDHIIRAYDHVRGIWAGKKSPEPKQPAFTDIAGGKPKKQ